MWQDIISVIKQYKTFIITSHINPDCDALGSEIALARHLSSLNKKVKILNHDIIPPAYRFLDSKRRVKRYVSAKHDAEIAKVDVIIVVDASGGWKRVGRPGEKFEQAKAVKLCIDHHPDPVNFVDIAVVDTDAAAAAQLIYDLIIKMGGEITKRMAQALYAGILTDTGCFRFPKTTPHTHHVVADLLARGVEPLYVYKQIYEQYPVGRLYVKGEILSNLKLAAEGQIAYYTLTQDILKPHKINPTDLDGFASLGQEIKGVRVVIYGAELSKTKIKISLRSDGTVPINHIAAEYGGGGHAAAAGASLLGKLSDIMPELVYKVEQAIREADSTDN